MSAAEDINRMTRGKKNPLKEGTKRYPASGRNSSAEVSSVLDRIGTKLRFARGSTIFNEGDPIISLYKVISGAVRLCKYTAGGRRQIADFTLPEEFFGFVRVGDHMLTAEAITDVVLISYPVQQVERLGDEMPAIRKRLFDFLSERVLGMQDHLVMLGRQTAIERVAAFLLLLLERNAPGRGNAVDLPMSRLDIADYLGLTLETVSRALADLKHAHAIDLEGPHLVLVRDVEAMRSLAAGDDGKRPA